MKTTLIPALALTLAALGVPALAWDASAPGSSAAPRAGCLGFPLGKTLTLVGRADRPKARVVHMAENPGGFLVTEVNGRHLRQPVLISLENVKAPLPSGSAWVVTGHEAAVARGGAATSSGGPLQAAGGYRLCFVVRTLRRAAGIAATK